MGEPPPLPGEQTGGSPTDAFAVLGHELRLAILQTLYERYDPTAHPGGVMPPEVEPLSYSELLARLDTDDHGKLNYHLGKLLDRFIRRTDDGYELTDVGFTLVRTIIEGSTIETPLLPLTETDFDCPLCGAPVLVDYRNGAVRGRCARCPGVSRRSTRPHGSLWRVPFPPNGLRQRTHEEFATAAHRLATYRILPAVEGTCPSCASTTQLSVEACTDHRLGDDGLCQSCNRHELAIFLAVCDTCKALFTAHLGFLLINHPAVVSFYHARGLDYRVEPGELWAKTLKYDEALISTDPLQVRVTITAGDDELRVTLDEEANVVAQTAHQPTE